MPSSPPRPRRVVIVGAGVSGLVAARELMDAGVDVLVLDKGRSVGGRLATRRIGDARLDHGAQFFTARSPAFQARVDDWIERGVVTVWNHGFDADHGDGDGDGDGTGDGDGSGDGHPRYVGVDGMNSIAKDLAQGVTVETSTLAFGLRPGPTSPDGGDDPGDAGDDPGDGDDAGGGGHRWEVAVDDGTSRPADAVIFTCPLPQTFALLADVGVWSSGDEATDEAQDAVVARLGIDLDRTLFRTAYDRTIGLLVTLDGPADLPSSGGVQDADDVFSFIGDNRSKGISPVPAVTFHANPQWSESHWDDDPDDLRATLLDAAAEWIGPASVVEAQVKKWRLATPRSIWPDPCWSTAEGTIVCAGDAFAGPKVEGAHNSGLAAAHLLLA